MQKKKAGIYGDEILKRRKTSKDVTVDADALATAKSAHAKLKRQMQSLLTQLALKNETKEEEERRETTLENESQVHMPLTENALKLRAVQEGRLLNISNVVSQLVCAETIIRESGCDPVDPDEFQADFLRKLRGEKAKSGMLNFRCAQHNVCKESGMLKVKFTEITSLR